MTSECHWGPGLLFPYSPPNFLHGLDVHGLDTGTIYQVLLFKLRSPAEALLQHARGVRDPFSGLKEVAA
jgi:hypothetical protein